MRRDLLDPKRVAVDEAYARRTVFLSGVLELGS